MLNIPKWFDQQEIIDLVWFRDDVPLWIETYRTIQCDITI